MAFADFLIQFDETDSPRTQRVAGQPWVRVAQNGFASAYLSEPSTGITLVQRIVRGHWRFWLLGELFHYLESDRPRSFTQFAEDAVAGRERPQDLNGHFCMFALDEARREWHTWTNRLGTTHVYARDGGMRPVIGTYYAAVIADGKRGLDWIGLAGYSAFGFFPEDRTFYESVRLLRPATHTVFGADGRVARASQYWHWQYSPDRSRSYTQTVAAFGDTLTAIMRDHAGGGRAVLPISGGLDSRTLAATVTGLGRQASSVWAYSYGYTSDSAETRIASRIAKARGFEFQPFTISDYLFPAIGGIHACVEGFQSVTSTRQAGVINDVASHGDYLLAGHWGDVWMSANDLSGSAGSELDLVAAALTKIQKPGGEWLLEHLCQPHFPLQRLQDVLRSVIAGELNRLEQIADPDFKLTAFKTEQWSFRWTVPSLRMFQPAMFVRLPFYDNRMVDFISTVPRCFLRGRRLQLDYLKAFHADLASITWDATDSSLYFANYYDSLLLPKRIGRKLQRLLSGKKHIGRNWMVQFLTPSGKAGLESWLLRPGRRIHGLVGPKIISVKLDDMHRAPDAANGYAVSQLLTLSVRLEHDT